MLHEIFSVPLDTEHTARPGMLMVDSWAEIQDSAIHGGQIQCCFWGCIT